MGALRKMPLPIECDFFRTASYPIPRTIFVFSVCWDVNPYTTTHGTTERISLRLLTDKTKDINAPLYHSLSFRLLSKKHEIPLLNHFNIPHANTSYTLPRVLGPHPKIQVWIYTSCKCDGPSN